MAKTLKKHIVVIFVFILISSAFVMAFFLFVTDAKRLHQKGQLKFPIKRPNNITQPR